MVRLRTLVPVAALTSILDSVTTVYAFHVLTGKGYLVVERSVMTAEIIRHVLATDPLITSAVLASFFFFSLMASYAIYLYIYRLLYRAVKGRIPGYLSPTVIFSVILVIHGAVVASNIYQILSVEI
jgi:glucan phosphoethanolaminetransferase (alkaline phosphatase superfamily)